jgi:hypothetical protein
MANPLDVMQMALDFIAIGRGLPKGSIKPGDLSPEELFNECHELAQIITLASWAMIGTLIAGEMEYDKTDVDFRKALPPQLKTFPIYAYKNYKPVLEFVLDRTFTVYPFRHPEIYYTAVKTGKTLTPEERDIILKAAIGGNWNTSYTRNTIYGFSRAKKYNDGMAEELVAAMKTMIARRGDFANAQPDDSEGDDRGDVAEQHEGD